MSKLFRKFRSRSEKTIMVDPKSVALWDKGWSCPICGNDEHFNWCGDDDGGDGEYYVLWGYNGDCDLHGMVSYEQNFDLEDVFRYASANKKTIALDPATVRTYRQKGNRCPECDTSAFSDYLVDENVISDREYTLGYTCRCGNCGSIFGYADKSYLEDMIKHPTSKLELVSLIKKPKKHKFGFLKSKNEIADMVIVDPTKIKIYWDGPQCYYCGTDLLEENTEDTSLAFPEDRLGMFGGSGTIKFGYDGRCHDCKGYVQYNEVEYPEDVLQTAIESDNYHAMTEIIYTAWRMGKISDEEFDRYSDELYAAHKEWCDKILHRKRSEE